MASPSSEHKRHRPLRLTVTARVGPNLAPFLRRHLRSAHQLIRPPLIELSVALVGDAAMSRLHEQFMGIAGPTDVLTFPIDEDERGRIVSGEVVVCVPEARRRARLEGTELRQEVLLYALHGLLHLCGYDDQSPAEFARMHRAEDRILARIGVGAVFHRAKAQAASGTKGRGSRRPAPRAAAAPESRRGAGRKSGKGKGLRGKR